ncbi:MAG: adenosylcobinamide-GDP ribazoletransferase [Treponema sp.]|nr:adenosylcobinamide-GDP ribazoletransferase [Treponema sp.]
MAKFFKGFYMSLGMFCAIPLPAHIWDETCVNQVLVCFPLIGAIIGGLWLAAAKLLLFGKINLVLASAVTAVFPFIASGFLHLDGYMDTSDAVLSRRTHEEKLRILKDPHTGSFAVIMLAVLFTLQFACAYGVTEKNSRLLLLITIPVISRCCSSISILCLKTLAQSGYANMFKKNTGTAQILPIIIFFAAGILLSFLFAGVYGLIAAAAVIAGFYAAMGYAYSDLKGVSGDLTGFALVIAECCGLAAMALM